MHPTPRRPLASPSAGTRRRLAALGLALATSTAAGCGFHAQTNQVYQAGVGTNVQGATIDVLGAVIVSAKPGKGTFVASLNNNDQAASDTLTGASGQGVSFAGSSPVTVAGGALVNLGAKPGDGLPVTGAGIKPGAYVSVRLTFSGAGEITVQVPVVTDTGPYAGLAGAP